jgi:palmitoyltransferase
VQRMSYAILLQTWADIIPESESHAINLAFAIIFGLCLYNFFRAITLDPGLCPRPAHDGELKAVSLLMF